VHLQLRFSLSRRISDRADFRQNVHFGRLLRNDHGSTGPAGCKGCGHQRHSIYGHWEHKAIPNLLRIRPLLRGRPWQGELFGL